MKKALCLLLSICILTVMCTSVVSAEESLVQGGSVQKLNLVERGTRVEENGTIAVDYDIVEVPSNSNANAEQNISYPVIRGRATLDMFTINTWTKEFHVTVTIFGSTISKCFAVLDAGDDINYSLAAHPAGISNRAYLNCQVEYPYAGTYTARLIDVTVYPVSGEIIYDLSGNSEVTFSIWEGYAD